jgi:transposase
VVVIRKRISRAKMLEFFANLKPCLVGIEACPAARRPITGVANA